MVYENGSVYSLDWTTGLDYWTGLSFDLKLKHYAHAQDSCTCSQRPFFVTVLLIVRMSGQTGGIGTLSSPIVLASDSETESDDEMLVQVPGSPLKVICSERCW